jgi:nucleotide-binding universal stress UspA family protein
VRAWRATLSPEDKRKYRATFALRNGIAAQEILLYLQEHPDVDLVVMATHGRGGVARLMMGSVADKIVRAARCPVVTIRVPELEEQSAGRAA